MATRRLGLPVAFVAALTIGFAAVASAASPSPAVTEVASAPPSATCPPASATPGAAAVAATSMGSASAPSPAPSSSSPADTSCPPGAPADPVAACAALATMLPPLVTGHPLRFVTGVGPNADLDNSYASLRGALGVGIDALCQVKFRYGHDVRFSGAILRFDGADPALLLEEYLADKLAAWTAGGGSAKIASIDLGARTVAVFEPGTGQGPDLYFSRVADAVVEMDGLKLAEAVAPALPGPGQALPGPGSPSASP